MKHIFVTTENSWLLEGIRGVLQKIEPDVQVYGVTSPEGLLRVNGFWLLDSVLILAFPDNRPVDCLRSLMFLNEWERKWYPWLPILRWGGAEFFCATKERVPIIPWRLSQECLPDRIMLGMDIWRWRIRDGVPVHYQMKLTRREMVILRYTLEGYSPKKIAVILNINPKTVLSHKYNAMTALGINSRLVWVDILSAR